MAFDESGFDALAGQLLEKIPGIREWKMTIARAFISDAQPGINRILRDIDADDPNFVSFVFFRFANFGRPHGAAAGHAFDGVDMVADALAAELIHGVGMMAAAVDADCR